MDQREGFCKKVFSNQELKWEIQRRSDTSIVSTVYDAN